MAGIIEGTQLPYDTVYLATAIGAGSLVGSWMNDSGFWIFAKMSGLTETEALKTWTPLLLVLAAFLYFPEWGVSYTHMAVAAAIFLPLLYWILRKGSKEPNRYG